jgi:predicted TIM-barrel fold metal-dependent hydrolase
MTAAAERGVPVLQHAWLKTTGNQPDESAPQDVAELARRHPQVTIIMAHLNGHTPRGIEAVVNISNVVVDTSGGDPESGMLELAVLRLGAKRVLFGSDAPVRHFGVSLAKVLGAELPERAKCDILWNNAARLLPPWSGVAPLEVNL